MATNSHPLDEILAWANKQPAWRQDALRRILTKPFVKVDENECLELLKAAHGIGSTKLTATPLDAKHLPVRSSSSTNLRLAGLDDIANVNRLAKDASLSLAVEGLTLIYGDNGSGKSGFIRILKKACRARDHEEILPDVFASRRANSPASARFIVEEGAKKLDPIIWLDDGKSSADFLGRFSIFDSKCASVHVDGENRIEVVPHNLDCFERLAHVCDRLRARLKEEFEGLEMQLAGALPDVPKGTSAERFVGSLSQKMEADLVTVCNWKDADQKRLTELAGMLKDPIAEARKSERISVALKEFAYQLRAASTALSDTRLLEIMAFRQSAQDLRRQANASAAAAFAAEPLRGVGEELWRALFDAARAYSERHAYPGGQFPRADAEAKCVLCQQSLDAAAQDRFARFAGFVTGAMNEKARVAEEARDAVLLAIRPITLPIADLSKEARDYLATANKQLGDNSALYRSALLKRRTEVLAAKDVVSLLPNDPDAALHSEVISLEASAQEARALAATGSAGAASIRTEHGELAGRKMLHDNESESQASNSHPPAACTSSVRR